MAKFVVAGKADCPFYAKAELLADELALKLPNFKIHKIVKRPEEWDGFLAETCKEKGWKHNESPLIWRELVDRGGGGILLGGCNDFLEMAQGYYGINSRMLSDKLVNISKESLETCKAIEEEERAKQLAYNPLRVCVYGASSDLAYATLGYLSQGEVFGPDQEISITLLDRPETLDVLAGVAYEVQDCARPLLRSVDYTSDPQAAFKDTNVAILIDGTPVLDISDKHEQFLSNAKVFKELGKALDMHASRDVKVLIAGGNANLNTYITSRYAPSIPKKNFCALSRSEENKAKGFLAKKLNVATAGVKDVIIWGSPGFDHFPDASHSRVDGYDGAIWGPHIAGFTRSIPEMVHDNNWLAGEFLDLMNVSSTSTTAITGGAALISQLQDWWRGTSSEIWSLGVISEGWYGIPEGIVFSFPVKFEQGSWKVVEGIELHEALKADIQRIACNVQTETNKIVSELE